MIRRCVAIFIFLLVVCPHAFAAVEVRSVELGVGSALMNQTYKYPLFRLLDPDAAVLGPAGGACFEVGPSVEVLLAHDDFTIYDHMDTFTLGLHMGAGVSVEQFSMGLRYLRDLTNSYDGSLGGTLESVVNDGWALFLSLDVLPFFQ